MKKIILTLALIVGLTQIVFADDNAALQMKLAQQTAFQQRVSYILMQQAFVVLEEATNLYTTCCLSASIFLALFNRPMN